MCAEFRGAEFRGGEFRGVEFRGAEFRGDEQLLKQTLLKLLLRVSCLGRGPSGCWRGWSGSGLCAAGRALCSPTSPPRPCRLEEVPLEVLRQRESKWLDMLNNWDKWMAKKHKKVGGNGCSPGAAPAQLCRKRRQHGGAAEHSCVPVGLWGRT